MTKSAAAAAVATAPTLTKTTTTTTTTTTRLEDEYATFDKFNYWPFLFKDVQMRDTKQSCRYELSHAKLEKNASLNRYKNILPYDHSRVELGGGGDAQADDTATDYINANHVACERTGRKYILCQGPLKSTCEHFWQMCWEQKSKAIVMLNRLYEKGVLKCHMYYPSLASTEQLGAASGEREKTTTAAAAATLTFGSFRVTCVSEQVDDEHKFVTRVLECQHSVSGESRQFLHMHFVDWPDFGEPSETSHFLAFLHQCNTTLDIFNGERYGPAVVHCSAGVGRSGTFILIDSMIQLLKEDLNNCETKNMLKLLIEFRSYRMGLVQTYQQLKFAYRAVLDFVHEYERTDQPAAVTIGTDAPVEVVAGHGDTESVVEGGERISPRKRDKKARHDCKANACRDGDDEDEEGGDEAKTGDDDDGQEEPSVKRHRLSGVGTLPMTKRDEEEKEAAGGKKSSEGDESRAENASESTANKSDAEASDQQKRKDSSKFNIKVCSIN